MYSVYDVLAAEYNLEPIICSFCGSDEVTFHQYVEDAYCATCGRWQIGDREI